MPVSPLFEISNFTGGVPFTPPNLPEEDWESGNWRNTRDYISVGNFILGIWRVGRPSQGVALEGCWTVFKMDPDESFNRVDGGNFSGGTGVGTYFYAENIDYAEWDFYELSETDTHHWIMLVTMERVYQGVNRIRVLGIEKSTGKLVKSNGTYGIPNEAERELQFVPALGIYFNKPLAAVFGSKIVITQAVDDGTHYGINRWTFDWDEATRSITLDADHGVHQMFNHIGSVEGYDIFQGWSSVHDYENQYLLAEYTGFSSGDGGSAGLGYVVGVGVDGSVIKDSYTSPNGGAPWIYTEFSKNLDGQWTLFDYDGSTSDPLYVRFTINPGVLVMQDPVLITVDDPEQWDLWWLWGIPFPIPTDVSCVLGVENTFSSLSDLTKVTAHFLDGDGATESISLTSTPEMIDIHPTGAQQGTLEYDPLEDDRVDSGDLLMIGDNVVFTSIPVSADQDTGFETRIHNERDFTVFNVGDVGIDFSLETGEKKNRVNFRAV